MEVLSYFVFLLKGTDRRDTMDFSIALNGEDKDNDSYGTLLACAGTVLMNKVGELGVDPLLVEQNAISYRGNKEYDQRDI